MLDDFITRCHTKLLPLEKTHHHFQEGSRPAAVLFPIILRQTPTVLLTQRALNLPNHAGQIGFAGGKIEGDETALQAAIREAHEEIGLKERYITPIAQMSPKLTRTGFEIVTIIALIQPECHFHLNTGEVDSVFEVPLSFLMDEKNHRFRSRLFMGRERFYYTIPYQGHYIWGVTATLIHQLHDRLYYSAG